MITQLRYVCQVSPVESYYFSVYIFLWMIPTCIGEGNLLYWVRWLMLVSSRNTLTNTTLFICNLHYRRSVFIVSLFQCVMYQIFCSSLEHSLSLCKLWQASGLDIKWLLVVPQNNMHLTWMHVIAPRDSHKNVSLA